VLRSCWDYHRRPEAFRAWLAALEANGAALENSIPLARWNMDKRYLRDLESRGVFTVPTVWLEPGDSRSLVDLRRTTGWTDVVVKPAISATAWRLHRVRADEQAWPPALGTALESDAFLVQPFVAEIADGEWSLICFDGRFSHAVLKRPGPDDFRVQEEYGGRSDAAAPPAAVVEQAERLLDVLPERPLYARVDGVETRAGFQLLELELLEPVLFFGLHAPAVETFASAVEARARRSPAVR
jgi:glutathione synthase/RimK-type ligase-like ATP-grasp enzyme